MQATRRQANQPSPYEAAAESAIASYEKAQNDVRAARIALAHAEANAASFGRLAETLLAQVPEERRDAFAERLARLRVGEFGGRPSTVTYRNIVELFGNHPPRQWSVPEAHRELAAKGIPADPDQIQNVFQYLARKGRLKRVSRGRYIIVGYGVGIEGDPEGGYE